MSNSTEGLERANSAYLTTNVYDLLSLKDRVVVITGGARGIGLALGFAVAEAGGIVVVVDALKEPHEHYALLQKICPRVKIYQSDVSDHGVLKATFDEIVKDFGRIDGLITAAGICPDQPFMERDPQSVKRCFDINTLGTFYSAQLAAQQMSKQERLPSSSCAGSIIFIASVAAHKASQDQYLSDYCSSKGAVLSLAKELGVELAEKGIRVNCISPGYIMTDMTLTISDSRPSLANIFVTEPPMKRMGDRKDLKGAAVYLLSEASAYMTGGELLITGGIHVGRGARAAL